MNDWLGRKISRDDFDLKARCLFTAENVHIHNNFLFAIMEKCRIDANDGNRRRKRNNQKSLKHLNTDGAQLEKPYEYIFKITSINLYFFFLSVFRPFKSFKILCNVENSEVYYFGFRYRLLNVFV